MASDAVRSALARVALGRLEQLMSTLLPHDPRHAALHGALAATVQPLQRFLCYDEHCGRVPCDQRAPADACRRVFSAANDAVLLRMLRFLPAEAMAAVEQTSSFFRGAPELPPLPPLPPSRVARAVLAEATAAGLAVKRKPQESWSELLRFVQRSPRRATCAAGREHTLTVRPDGALFSCGSGRHGCTGHGDEQDRLVMTRVKSLEKEHAVCVAAGTHHSLVVVQRGAVFSFGCNHHAQLGQDHGEWTPTEMYLTDEWAVAAAAGDRHSMILTRSGNVFTCGYAGDGYLGLDLGVNMDVDFCVDRPKLVTALADKRVTAVAAGLTYSLMVTADGCLYMCGSPGWLGEYVPTLVAAFAGKRVDVVATGAYGSMAVTADGDVFSWDMEQPVPKRIGALTDERVVAVAVGASHSLMVTASGKLYSCGDNGRGQLGHALPTEVPGFDDVVEVAAGDAASSFARTRAGALYGWGCGAHGCLGQGDTSNRTRPARVPLGPDTFPLP